MAYYVFSLEFQVPLWYQKASRNDDGFVMWDYHVICIQVKAKLV
jgi:hypothetical protein